MQSPSDSRSAHGFSKNREVEMSHFRAVVIRWRSHRRTDGDLKFSIASSKHFLKNLDGHIIEIYRKVSRLGYVWHFGFDPELELVHRQSKRTAHQ